MAALLQILNWEVCGLRSVTYERTKEYLHVATEEDFEACLGIRLHSKYMSERRAGKAAGVPTVTPRLSVNELE